MGLEWSSDFSYDYFRKLLQAVKSNFEVHCFSEVPHILKSNSAKPQLLLRHDVDVDLNRALKMAEIEKEFGISATYMMMINSPLYRVENLSSQSVILHLISMGHEVGLHFDFDNNEHRNSRHEHEIGSVEPEIDLACRLLEDIICSSIKSISFHRPLPQFLRGPLTVAGRVNAYSQELMAWYLSDSKGNWREGEPLPELLSPDRPLLQLLIHPIWWGNEHMSPQDRLQAFFESTTQGCSPEQVRTLDATLARHISVWRSGAIEQKGNDKTRKIRH